MKRKIIDASIMSLVIMVVLSVIFCWFSGTFDASKWDLWHQIVWIALFLIFTIVSFAIHLEEDINP